MAKNTRSHLTNSLQQSLTAFRESTPQFAHKTKQVFRSNLPNLDRIGDDGYDHINIWENGITELGKVLSHTSDIPFTHSVYGKFRSVEGFWHYIRSVSRDDRCRMYYGNRARMFGKSLESQQVDNFREIIMDANWQKIRSYPLLMKEIELSDQPFDSYYYMGETRARAASAFWMIEGFEEIRTAIKNNRNPDFEFLRSPGATPLESKPIEVAPKEPRHKHKTSSLTSRLTQKPTEQDLAYLEQPVQSDPDEHEVDDNELVERNEEQDESISSKQDTIEVQTSRYFDTPVQDTVGCGGDCSSCACDENVQQPVETVTSDTNV